MGFDYSYTMNGLEEVGGLAIGIMIAYLLIGGISGILSLVSYILESLGMYTIAERRQLKRPWMAWVPVVNQYLLGCISDQYQYVTKGRNTSRRKWLLGFSIVSCVLVVAVIVLYVQMFIGMIHGAMNDVNDMQMAMQVLSPVLGILALALVLVGVSVAQLVFYYIALYDLYVSCDSKNGVIFLVLSVILPVTLPFLVFAVRNKDQGMPPRKSDAQPAPQVLAQPQTPPEQEPAQEPVCEPVSEPETAPVEPIEETE